jgi:GT2 family glycosyltransferase
VLCPVTGALQLIRHETLETIGIYDPGFRMAHEDMDYCLRVFKSGRECIYEPSVCAFHHESVFRGRPTPKIQQWQVDSFKRLLDKWGTVDFSNFTPALV